MSWYYVDQGGNTQGPLNLNAMKSAYSGKKLKDQSFVWNGADVNQWTPLNKVPKLLNQLKPQNIPKPQSNAPPKKKPRRGGGRMNLLAGIRRGAKLRKAPKPVEQKVGEPKKKKPGQKLSLQEQMALTLKNRQNKKKTNTSAPKKNTTAPKKSYNAPKTTNEPKLTWKQKQELKKKEQQNKSTNSYSNNNNSSSSNSGRIGKITNKLKNAQEWQLKAIEKLLS